MPREEDEGRGLLKLMLASAFSVDAVSLYSYQKRKMNKNVSMIG
jgi:hypothetical protein